MADILSPPKRKHNILLVDDRPENMMLLEDMLANDDFVFIKGGSFDMGYDKIHNVSLSDFWLSKYEVTQEQWEAAVDAYSNAIKNNPELSWSHNNLAESLVKLERWEEAINAYRRAIELNPDFSWSHNNLADVLLKLERWEEAVVALV